MRSITNQGFHTFHSFAHGPHIDDLHVKQGNQNGEESDEETCPSDNPRNRRKKTSIQPRFDQIRIIEGAPSALSEPQN
jgi:hypothetical protein